MKTASLFTTARTRSQRHTAAFTLIELLVVIAIMGILASFLVGLAPVAGAKMRESRVRAELESLTLSIEAYKSKYGFYPPDGYEDPTTKRVDPRINPLYYELSGMQVINPKSATEGEFRTVLGTAIKPDLANRVFGRDGFVNAGQDRRKLFSTSFRDSQHAALVDPITKAKIVDILVAGAPFPTTYSLYPIKDVKRSGLRLDGPTVNPWRYVSTNPTNNPTTFDLWAEVPVRDKDAPGGYRMRIIGNWKNR
jgi:prepilin-type N-terminal cleavage/methylation domain-containing protein